MQVAVEFCFALHDAFGPTKSLEVSESEVGDVAKVRFCNARKLVDFTLMVGAHFNNG